jgi:hypothetical protein
MSGRWDRSASSSWGRQGRGSGGDSWLGLATQMMFLPFTMLGWGTQLLTGTGQGVQRLGDCGCNRGRGDGGGWDRGSGDGGGYGGSWNQGRGDGGGWNRAGGLTGGTGAPDWSRQAAPPPPAWPAPASTPPNPPQNSGTGNGGAAGAVPNRAETKQREEKDMACDTDLSGTDLKIIEYTIVSVDPDIQYDEERILQPTRTIATTEDMNENGFIAWVIAMYFQQPDHRRLREGENWKQYLRVCYCVKCRMGIPETDCCQEQANALRDINRTLQRIGLRENDQGSGDNLPAKTR